MIKKFEEEKKDNPKFKEMNNQLGIMKKDYQDMLQAREVTRKQLEARFQDIRRNIQRNFDFTSSEVKRTKDILKAFNSKFSHNLKIYREEFEQKIQDFRDFNRKRLKETKDRLDNIENTIHEMREDRVEAPYYERPPIIEKEEEIIQALDDNVYELTKTVENEKTERILNVGKFKDDAKDTLTKYQKSITEFQTKAVEEFNKVKDKIEVDVFDRLEAQDDLVDNLSNSVKNFQDTLKKISD
ncbi:unnamed protein product [Moneuplotes crassus]|uniref:SF-assemblin n=2 Tax=Euplotes crassus TaxID=5936 RepID=A0AAD2D4M7_EUPCR|nr:unnamed protein product [Moneuplotes crassus]